MWPRNYRKWKVKRPRPPSHLITIMHGVDAKEEREAANNDKAEIAAVKAEVESVEKATEVKTAPAIQEVAAVNKIEEPARAAEIEKPMLRENGATTKAEQEKQPPTVETEAVRK